MRVDHDSRRRSRSADRAAQRSRQHSVHKTVARRVGTSHLIKQERLAGSDSVLPIESVLDTSVIERGLEEPSR